MGKPRNMICPETGERCCTGSCTILRCSEKAVREGRERLEGIERARKSVPPKYYQIVRGGTMFLTDVKSLERLRAAGYRGPATPLWDLELARLRELAI